LLIGYEDDGFLVCAMHPAGPETVPCPDLDFVEDDWFPSATDLVDREIILAQTQFLEYCERNIKLMIHPRLTGRCPDCGFEFDRCKLPREYWDCDQCGWMDDLDFDGRVVMGDIV
jgi:predicted RNA-binding Zn-ribbon protein involved in translation (DUF1610 family)